MDMTYAQKRLDAVANAIPYMSGSLDAGEQEQVLEQLESAIASLKSISAAVKSDAFDWDN